MVAKIFWNLLAFFIAIAIATIAIMILMGTINQIQKAITKQPNSFINNFFNSGSKEETFMSSIIAFLTAYLMTITTGWLSIELSLVSIICVLLPVFYQLITLYINGFTIYYGLGALLGIWIFIGF